MLILRRLVEATPAPIKERAANQCFSQVYKPPRTRLARDSLTKSGGYLVTDGDNKYREFKFRTKCTDGWRRTAVRFYGALSLDTPCWCWCDCPYFKYHCEVALAKHGSSSVVQSNGQRPRKTNPLLEPRVCKHVYRAIQVALRRRTPGENQGAVNRPATVRKHQTVRDVWTGQPMRNRRSPGS